MQPYWGSPMTIFQDNGYCRGEILSLYPAESTDECLNQIIQFFWKKESDNEFSVGKKSESEGFVFWAYLASVSKHEYSLRPTAAAVEEESASSTEEQTWWSPERLKEMKEMKEDNWRQVKTSENDIGWRFACFWFDNLGRFLRPKPREGFRSGGQRNLMEWHDCPKLDLPWLVWTLQQLWFLDSHHLYFDVLHIMFTLGFYSLTLFIIFFVQGYDYPFARWLCSQWPNHSGGYVFLRMVYAGC